MQALTIVSARLKVPHATDLSTSADLRALRIRADYALSCRRPGWHTCIFHGALKHSQANVYTCVYTITATEDSEPEFIRVTMAPLSMGDGSFNWCEIPNVHDFSDVGVIECGS